MERGPRRGRTQEAYGEDIFLAGEVTALYTLTTVMILVSSYSYSINRENDVIPAIIYTTHAGAFLGKAVAMTLYVPLAGMWVSSGRSTDRTRQVRLKGTEPP